MIYILKCKKKGGIDVYIAVFISLFFMLVMFTYTTNMLTPVNKYIAINNLVRKYTLKMEKDGGLTSTSLNNLRSELSSAGIVLSNVTITPSPSIDTYAKFGTDVSLQIQYNYLLTEKSVNGLNITNTSKTVSLKVKKTTVSKNASY